MKITDSSVISWPQSQNGIDLENIANTPKGVKIDQIAAPMSEFYAAGDITGFSLLAHTQVAKASIEPHLGRKDVMRYDPFLCSLHLSGDCRSCYTDRLPKKRHRSGIKQLPMYYAGRLAENEQTVSKVIV